MTILVLFRTQWATLPWVYGPWETEGQAREFYEQTFQRKDKITAAYIYESAGCARCRKLQRIVTLKEP